MALRESDLLFDWNTAEDNELRPARGRVSLSDETLRDGLQSPSAHAPSLEARGRILRLLAEVGVERADIGLPGAGPQAAEAVERLAREAAEGELPIELTCAARPVAADVEAIIEISRRAGVPIGVSLLIGSGPIRQYAESWSLDHLLEATRKAVELGVGAGLPVTCATEDTTRATPEDLASLYIEAVEAGARRVVVADTVGHATPAGAANVVRFVREVVDGTGAEVAVDWHGHRDRGLSVANALAAAAAGADGLQGSILGLGERVGSTPLDVLLVNLQLMGWGRYHLRRLPELCRLVAEVTGVPLPGHYPVVGRDAFRTAAGVHAAALIKARSKGEDWLADRVYSGVPASLVGRRHEIEVGPESGESNVYCWLEDHGVPAERELVEVILERAKASPRVLATEEILAICHDWRAGMAV